ncbi:unnamed protein product [Toxocara canis]|uniref:Chitin-binding type-3 domain-containing protein n=1 Tax=Toxocara canis TaxID=6265 RepID=A0A183UUW7_TOXCA|nr:unnamed protein product [Toxocara canis]
MKPNEMNDHRIRAPVVSYGQEWSRMDMVKNGQLFYGQEWSSGQVVLDGQEWSRCAWWSRMVKNGQANGQEWETADNAFARCYHSLLLFVFTVASTTYTVVLECLHMVTATTVNYSRDKESMKIAATLITVVVVISEIAPPFSAGLPEGLVNSRERQIVRLKRHPQGYGYGTGSYFYGHYGGGVNNNYGGVNIGAINRKNINL